MELTRWQHAFARIALAVLVAGGWAVLCYFLVDWMRPDSGLVSVSFTMIQPAVICAFIAYVGDPLNERSAKFYALVAPLSALGMILVSIVFLQEGAVCTVMLAPLWILFGWFGTAIVYSVRKRFQEKSEASTFMAHGLLALPLATLLLEGMVPPPVEYRTVSREIIIDAPAETIWPMMEGIGQVAADDGRWNITQDLIGIPKPQHARLEGQGVGAIRHARWERGVHFEEIITEWEPGGRLGWRFDFAQSGGWEITDAHLHPAGPHMRILTGGYTLEPLGDGRHILRLTTHYAAQTHLNAYAALWGELFLGDIHDNILTVIKRKAEAADGAT